jgi:hypothetical protein
MRHAVVALLTYFVAQTCLACSCLSPERLAVGSRDLLQHSTYVVHAHVEHVAADGRATIRVLESFKGPRQGEIMEVMPKTDHRCGTVEFVIGEEALIRSSGETVNYCSKIAPMPFLLEALRAASAR